MQYIFGYICLIFPHLLPQSYRERSSPIKGAEKMGHWGGGIVYHLPDARGPLADGVATVLGVRADRVRVSSTSSGSSEGWEVVASLLRLRR